MIAFLRNIVGFSIGVLIGRGFSNKDPIGIAVSIMAGIAFIVMLIDELRTNYELRKKFRTRKW